MYVCMSSCIRLYGFLCSMFISILIRSKIKQNTCIMCVYVCMYVCMYNVYVCMYVRPLVYVCIYVCM